MIFVRKIIDQKYFIAILWMLHCVLSVLYSIRLPWGGDEWYTYYDYVLVGTPNNFLIMILKEILGPVSLHNFMIYRQVGLFWTSFIYLVTFLFLRKELVTESIKKFLFINIVFITFSPFVFFQEQYFRYYGLYLFASFVCNLAILFHNNNYQKKRWMFYLLLPISISIHYLLTWQLFFYMVWKEWSYMNARNRTVFSIILSISGVAIISNWNALFKWFMNIGSDYSLYIGDIHGWSKATFIKPFLSVFQYLFGEDIIPLENWTVIILFALSIAIFVYSIMLLTGKEKTRTILDFSFASLIPFVLMFIFLEPMTPPGATQLIAKHGLFFISWLIVLYIPVFFDKNIIIKWLSRLIFLIAILYGSFFSLTMAKEDWGAVVDVAKGDLKDKTVVLVDGRSDENFRLYSADKIKSNQIVNFFDTTILSKILNESMSISVVLGDYRSYQYLSKEQMWNTGTGSEDRISKLNYLFSQLEKYQFKAVNSYSFFPLMCFRYIKNTSSDNQIIPWFHGIKYQGINLPVSLPNGDTLLGWKRFEAPFDVTINATKFYYFIELAEETGDKETIELFYSDGDSLKLPVLIDNDPYRKFADRKIANSKVVYEWHKRPLISTSLAYPGSWLPATGYLYRYQSNKKISRIKSLDPEVRIRLFVLK